MMALLSLVAKNGDQVKKKDIFPRARFFPCHDHQLNLVLKRAC
jgi:hypothetical protein